MCVCVWGGGGGGNFPAELVSKNLPPLQNILKKLPPPLEGEGYFVLNNDDAELTLDLFSVLTSCDICPG